MKIVKSFLLTAFLFLTAANVFATAQYPDKIIYKGETHKLHSNPMEAYFQKFPDKKPQGGVVSSALWRGYVATFEIDNDSLYLKDIHIQNSKKTTDGSFETKWVSKIDEVVTKGERLKIEWLQGLLVIPQGKMINYVHMGYGSTYEKYTLLEIDKGSLTKSMDFDYKEYTKFKVRQFEAFKKTEEYKKLVADMKKREDTSDEFIESFLKSFVINYTSKILVD